MFSLLNILLLSLLILAMFYIMNGYRENFKLFNGYSKTDSNLLLDDVYRTKKEYTLNGENYNKELNKTTPVSSYAQVTNNKREWDQPDNYQCTPIDLCNVFYKKREKTNSKDNQQEYEFCLPNINSKQTRINYYFYEN